MSVVGLVSRRRVQIVDTCVGRQAPHVLESARRVTAYPALRIVDAGLRKRHGGSAVNQLALGHQRTDSGLHKAGFHLDRDNTHIQFHTARRMRHRHVQQSHAGAAVGNVKTVQVLWLRGVVDLCFTAFKLDKFKTEVFNKRNVD